LLSDFEGPEITRIRKKRDVTEYIVSKQEWNAFKTITRSCKGNSRNIGLDLLTLAENDHIVSLNLSTQGMKRLPSAIRYLSHLKRLLLIDNELTTLPSEITTLNRLQVLYLDRNPLGTIPQEILNLTQLQQLSLGETHLNDIPKEINNLSQLDHLWLNDNTLSSLPHTLGNLVGLQRLDLRGNQGLKSFARNWTGKILIAFLRNIRLGITL